MKHSILCCAVTGALASGAAFAADTQIYGVIDTGFSVRNNQYVNGNSDTTTRMVSGQYIGSRFGIKGSEDLGNGYKAGFVLESSIKTDDGSLGQGGRLWGREARVYLSGDFGEVSFGRVGPIVGGSLQVVSLGYEYIDNSISYVTPKFAGVDATFQYSFGSDTTSYGDGVEGKSSVERMYSAALRYQNSALLVSAGVEGINQDQPSADRNGLDDAPSVNPLRPIIN